MFAFTGGTAFVVAYRDLGTKPIAYPFVICCALLGLTIGTVVALCMRRQRKPTTHDEQRAE
jgi:hypothetical protein